MVYWLSHFIIGVFVYASFGCLAQQDDIELKAISEGKLDTFVSTIKFEDIDFDKRSQNASPISTSISYELTSTTVITTLALSWLRNGKPLEVPRVSPDINAKPKEMYSTEIPSADHKSMKITLYLRDAAIVPGNYTLIVTKGANSAATSGFVKSAPILPSFYKPKRVLEGDVFRIACYVSGYPKAAEVFWWFAPIPVGQTEEKGALTDSIRQLQSLEFNTTRYYRETSLDGTPHDILIFKQLLMSDNGLYACNTSNSEGADITVLLVNVKDRWAALWPFIAIMTEVALAVAVILLYERYQMRMRPSAQLATGKQIPGTTENPVPTGGEYPPGQPTPAAGGNRLRTLVQAPAVRESTALPQQETDAVDQMADAQLEACQTDAQKQEELRLRGGITKC